MVVFGEINEISYENVIENTAVLFIFEYAGRTSARWQYERCRSVWVSVFYKDGRTEMIALVNGDDIGNGMEVIKCYQIHLRGYFISSCDSRFATMCWVCSIKD